MSSTIKLFRRNMILIGGVSVSIANQLNPTIQNTDLRDALLHNLNYSENWLNISSAQFSKVLLT